MLLGAMVLVAPARGVPAALPQVRASTGQVFLRPAGTVASPGPVTVVVIGRGVRFDCCGPCRCYGRHYGTCHGRTYHACDGRYRSSYGDRARVRSDASRNLENLARQYDPQLLGDVMETTPAPAPGPFETARDALRAGGSAAALDALHELLADDQHAEHGAALLYAGLAQALEGAFDDAGRSFEAAYEADAALRDQALDGAAILGSAQRLRTLAQRATRHAHRSPSRQAWVAVAVLVHAQGKTQRARELMAHAHAMTTEAAEPM